MPIDSSAAWRRVKAITALAAAGAAVLTAGVAFGAARNGSATTNPPSPATATRQRAYAAPRDATPQLPGSGFAAPEASTQPPQAMSGGS